MDALVQIIGVTDMDNQISLMDLYSPCKNCFHEYKGECGCLRSEFNNKRIPLNACDYYDSVSGGIPLEELRQREI